MFLSQSQLIMTTNKSNNGSKAAKVKKTEKAAQTKAATVKKTEQAEQTKAATVKKTTKKMTSVSKTTFCQQDYFSQ